MVGMAGEPWALGRLCFPLRPYTQKEQLWRLGHVLSSLGASVLSLQYWVPLQPAESLSEAAQNQQDFNQRVLPGSGSFYSLCLKQPAPDCPAFSCPVRLAQGHPCGKAALPSPHPRLGELCLLSVPTTPSPSLHCSTDYRRWACLSICSPQTLGCESCEEGQWSPSVPAPAWLRTGGIVLDLPLGRLGMYFGFCFSSSHLLLGLILFYFGYTRRKEAPQSFLCNVRATGGG